MLKVEFPKYASMEQGFVWKTAMGLEGKKKKQGKEGRRERHSQNQLLCRVLLSKAPV